MFALVLLGLLLCHHSLMNMFQLEVDDLAVSAQDGDQHFLLQRESREEYHHLDDLGDGHTIDG